MWDELSKDLKQGLANQKMKIKFLRDCFGHGTVLVSCQTGISGPLGVHEDTKWYLGMGITFRGSAFNPQHLYILLKLICL